jgi:diguanylate cyclase (GGDEF)-like protein
MNSLIKQILETLACLVNSQLVAIFNLVDFENCGVSGVLAKGEFISHSRDITIKFKNTPLEKVILTGQTSTYPGVLLKNLLLPFPTYDKTNSTFECLCIPLLGAEKKVMTGVIVLAQKTGTSLPSARLQMLKMLSPIVVSIVKVTQENEHWIQLATKDELTKLYTRPYFEKRLQEEIIRTQRYGKFLSILRIEINDFKKINEIYGYLQGNKVLQEFAKILAKSIREEIDIACRYSDQQFIVMLPNTSVDGAYVLAERIRQNCVQHFFKTEQGIRIKVTVSIGVAQTLEATRFEWEKKTESDETIYQEEILARSDLILQQSGHNQVIVYW